MGLAISNFIQMLDSITCTELMDYILYSSVEFDGLKVIHEDFPGVSALLNLLRYPYISTIIALRKGARTISLIVKGRISPS